MKNEDENISALQGLGPRSQEMLSRAGIKSVDQLKELGSLKAYMLAKASNESKSTLGIRRRFDWRFVEGNSQKSPYQFYPCNRRV